MLVLSGGGHALRLLRRPRGLGYAAGKVALQDVKIVSKHTFCSLVKL